MNYQLGLYHLSIRLSVLQQFLLQNFCSTYLRTAFYFFTCFRLTSFGRLLSFPLSFLFLQYYTTFLRGAPISSFLLCYNNEEVYNNQIGMVEEQKGVPPLSTSIKREGAHIPLISESCFVSLPSLGRTKRTNGP